MPGELDLEEIAFAVPQTKNTPYQVANEMQVIMIPGKAGDRRAIKQLSIDEHRGVGACPYLSDLEASI